MQKNYNASKFKISREENNHVQKVNIHSFPGVVLRNAGSPDLAIDFLNFLSANIFKKSGFVPVN
ncbi:hypothetical protein SpAn4DRAFT_2788 [Sporomusa ovata]|uniref:Uncharacterized protein n=1 Tax=Sporomusa ovata TaxID=2378 RepID=A0A0U1KY31_9FIRM|nr:hypothetical protein SpAn4DRAFT_2788 [Sporomusa ovata]